MINKTNSYHRLMALIAVFTLPLLSLLLINTATLPAQAAPYTANSLYPKLPI